MSVNTASARSKMLQRVLLGRHGVSSVMSASRSAAGSIASRGLLEALDELLNARIDARQLARARAARERARLLGERALQIREHLRVVVQLLLVEVARRLLVALLDQVPGRDEDFLLPARDLVLLLPAAAAAAAAAALALREAAVERLHLDEEQVGLHLAAAILGDGVVRNDVAGLERAALAAPRRFRPPLGRCRLLSLGRCSRLARGSTRRAAARRWPDGRRRRRDRNASTRSLADRIDRPPAPAARTSCVMLLEDTASRWPTTAVAVDVDRRRLPLAAVDRVAQLDAVETEVVVRLDAHA